MFLSATSNLSLNTPKDGDSTTFLEEAGVGFLVFQSSWASVDFLEGLCFTFFFFPQATAHREDTVLLAEDPPDMKSQCCKSTCNKISSKASKQAWAITSLGKRRKNINNNLSTMHGVLHINKVNYFLWIFLSPNPDKSLRPLPAFLFHCTDSAGHVSFHWDRREKKKKRGKKIWNLLLWVGK